MGLGLGFMGSGLGFMGLGLGPPGGSFGPLHGLGFMILGMGMDGEVDDFRGSTAALEWRRGLGWVGEEELGGANEAAGGDK